jgi:hypothetical protein
MSKRTWAGVLESSSSDQRKPVVRILQIAEIGAEIPIDPPPRSESTTVDKLVDVTGVEVIGAHRLRLTFEDGLVGDVDFTGRNWRRVFEPLADQAFFAQVRVDPEIGTVVWPNGVDMAPETLYERACKHQAHGSSRIPA